jgi:hypothetical protein
MIPLWIKVLCLCLILAGVETLHGIARTVLVVPKIGNKRARQYSVISGTLLAFAVCYVMIPWLDVHDGCLLIVIGLILAMFMALFDIVLARFVIKMKWRSIINDFNPAKGNYLILGLSFLVLIPYAVMKLKGLL